LQRENFFLDRPPRDELVAGDDTRLANAMRAVAGLIFHGGIPPRIKMNDGIRTGEVEADAAGFEADEEYRDIARLELLHDFAAVRRGAIEVTKIDLFRFQFVAEQMKHGDELTEDEDAMAAIDDFLEQLAEEIHFGRGPIGIDVVEFEEAEVATNLAQAEQRVEDDHAAAGEALRADGISDLAAAGPEQFGVNGLLVRGKIAPGDLLQFRRKVRGDFALEAAQHEWPEPAGEARLGGVALFPGDWNFVTLAKILRCAEVTRHEEVEDGPEI